MTTALNLSQLARALGGEVSGGQVLAPAPGHSKADRSMSVTPAPDAPDGLLVNSFAGDDWMACKDHVRHLVGIGSWAPGTRYVPPPARPVPPTQADPERTAGALAIWAQATDPTRTPVEAYLAARGVTLPSRAAGDVIRWHSRCPFGPGLQTGCMVALARHVVTDEPLAIHRTALTPDGRKAIHGGMSRRSLGPVAGAAVKLSANEDVETCLGVAEGIETALSIRALDRYASVPVWSLLSAGQLSALPVLSGIESLIVAVDNDQTGIEAGKTARLRWNAAGVEVQVLTTRTPGTDLNDLVRARHG